MGAPASHTPVTLRIVPRRPGHCFSGLTGIDMRHDNALHTPIQKTQDSGILMVRNARDRSNAKHFGSAHHVFHLVQVHRSVLTVDHDKVVADGPKQFHEVWCIAADDGAEHTLARSDYSRVAAVCPPVFPPARWHGRGDLSMWYYAGTQDVIHCVMEDVVPDAFLDLRWRHGPCQGKLHLISLQNCVRSTPRRLPMW